MIEDHFRKIIMIMGLDLSDDSLQNTPRRVARMFEEEIFSGLDPGNKPEITLLVQYYARYPQVQERLMVQIAEALKEAMGTEDVAV
jgi:GTP cyclohydrolase I